MEQSIAPSGEAFLLPTAAEFASEFQRLEQLAQAQRQEGREIVVVMGVGFVGAVMAAVVADSVDAGGRPGKFVIGVQRPSVRSYWKIPLLNRGECPVESEDPEVPRMIARCVLEKKTLTASFNPDALKLADVVVVDVQCDYFKNSLGNLHDGHADIAALEKSFDQIGQLIPPQCLVLIETTVPPGTTEHIALPVLKRSFEQRGLAAEPLLAHSYERVMPGRDYVRSIRDFWRVCAGVNAESRRRVEKFLNEVLNTKDFPLTVMDRPIESETCKIVENSYRATVLAFMHEWCLFAERNGVDLTKVIKAIKVRPTHSNIMLPGPGIGGYCLPKDGGLGLWAYRHILGFEDDLFRVTPLAIDINDTRALHVADLVRDGLKELRRGVGAARVTLLGASYREDVGDTRYSGSEVIVRKLAEMGATVRVHDPYVKHWWEFEKQDSYPGVGHSLARFFRNQEILSELRVEQDLAGVLGGADVVIFAVRHKPYLELDPGEVMKRVGRPALVVDAFNVLDDDKIRAYLKAGWAVRGMGKGHVERLRSSLT
ncbi:MAG: nucleotide sugar dehydrogenase [Kiritimatiellae bacterium]|nr:nucleotide sugar dehydrogenase [Kiritimatiellia bacterium]